MKKVLFIDDIREPVGLNGVIVVARSYEQAITFLKYNKFDIVSFDHDLGEEKSGYDVAKFILENEIKIGAFRCHTANPVGAFNIRQLLTHYGYKEVR